jgi:hypothetical protein
MPQMFRTEENTIINFSGGRTSGFLLRSVLDAYGGALPSNFVVLFQNTGKEFSQTLDFVNRVSQDWGVMIHWLEWQPPTHKGNNGLWVYPDGEQFKLVDYKTASRNGGPFMDLLRFWGCVPNVKQRFCTFYLKQKAARSFVQKRLGWDEWQSFLGIRHDEPHRWKTRGPDPKFKREERELPLVDAKITKVEVLDFWKGHHFDVDLPPGISNCDLCFLKGRDKKLSTIRKNPQLADWWDDAEKEMGRTFDKNLSYSDLKKMAQASPMLPIFNDEDLSTCFCTD